MKANPAQPPVRSVEERNALVVQWQRLPGRVLRDCWPYLIKGRLEWDDCAQEGFLGLVRAAEIWDPAKGLFVTFAWTVIKRRIYRAVRLATVVYVPESAQLLGHKCPRWVRPKPEAGTYGRHEPRAGAAPDASRFDDLRRAIDLLPGKERDVINMRLAGKEYGEIAAALGCVYQYAQFLGRKAIESLRRRLSGSLEGQGPEKRQRWLVGQRTGQAASRRRRGEGASRATGSRWPERRHGGHDGRRH